MPSSRRRRGSRKMIESWVTPGRAGTGGSMASCATATLKAVLQPQKSQESGHQAESADARRQPYESRRTGPDASAPPHFEVGAGTQVHGSTAESPVLRARSAAVQQAFALRN